VRWNRDTEKNPLCRRRLGHIAQVAVLPAFQHADNSELVALVSSDETKLRRLGRRYDVSRLYTYDRYDELLASGEIDLADVRIVTALYRSARSGKAVSIEPVKKSARPR
jgi:GFO/IDH/MocA oxidoreductase family protein